MKLLIARGEIVNKWLDDDGLEKDIVISSRVRLARNIEGMKLPQQIDEEDGVDVVDMVKHAVLKDDNYKTYNIKDLTEVEKRLFVENHLISPDMLKK